MSDVTFGDVSSGHVKVDVERPEVEISGRPREARDERLRSADREARVRRREGLRGRRRGDERRVRPARPALDVRARRRPALRRHRRPDRDDARTSTSPSAAPRTRAADGYLEVDDEGPPDRRRALRRALRAGRRGRRLALVRPACRGSPAPTSTSGRSCSTRCSRRRERAPGRRARSSASASIRRGGAARGQRDGRGACPLSRVDSLGALAQEVEGSVSGVAHVTGNLDDFRPDAGFVAQRRARRGRHARARAWRCRRSHLEVQMTQRMPQQKRRTGRTQVRRLHRAAVRQAGVPGGHVVARRVERQRRAARRHGPADGRGRDPREGRRTSRGSVSLRGARPRHARARLRARAKEDAGRAARRAAAAPVGGQLWGELIVDDVPLDEPAKASARFLLGPTVLLARGGKLALKPPARPDGARGRHADDPAARDDPRHGASGGFSGRLRGGSPERGRKHDARATPRSRWTRGSTRSTWPSCSASCRRSTAPRGTPRGEPARHRQGGGARRSRASCTRRRTTSRFTACRARSPICRSTCTRPATELDGDRARASSPAARWRSTATVPVRGLRGRRARRAHGIARGIRLAPADGVAAAFDADLGVTYDAEPQGASGGALPRVSRAT